MNQLLQSTLCRIAVGSVKDFKIKLAQNRISVVLKLTAH